MVLPCKQYPKPTAEFDYFNQSGRAHKYLLGPQPPLPPSTPPPTLTRATTAGPQKTDTEAARPGTGKPARILTLVVVEQRREPSTRILVLDTPRPSRRLDTKRRRIMPPPLVWFWFWPAANERKHPQRRELPPLLFRSMPSLHSLS
jgi:hypothetical protein